MEDNALKIWEKLVGLIGNPKGVAGVMGNMYAESMLKSNNLQDCYQKKFGMSDEEYTTAVDDGSYTKFATDCAGYGLVQWTFWSIKKDLLESAKRKNVSVGDQDLQIEVLCDQFQQPEWCKSVWEVLRKSESIEECTKVVLYNFERPPMYDKDPSILEERTRYANMFYEKYAKVYKVQVGAFYSWNNAQIMQRELQELGFDSYIVEEDV